MITPNIFILLTYHPSQTYNWCEDPLYQEGGLRLPSGGGRGGGGAEVSVGQIGVHLNIDWSYINIDDN